MPNNGQAPVKARRILWKWSIAALAGLLLFLLWQGGSALYSGHKLADKAAQRFHSQLNSGEYEDICSEAADEAFAEEDKHDQFIHFLDSIHRKLGRAGTAKQIHINVNVTGSGTFVTSQFSTEFEQGLADETFVWRKDGKLFKLYRYNVQSEAFLK